MTETTDATSANDATNSATPVSTRASVSAETQPSEGPVDADAQPLVTVVLCTYNRADRVGETIQAVLAQPSEDFELLVVDDGSTDATPEVLAAIDDPRVRVVRRANGGLCVARNTGLAEAAGRWTIFLDDDDVPEAGWLAALTEPMSDPTVGITCCGGTEVMTDGHPIAHQNPHQLGQPFGDMVGSYLPGTFAVRTDLARRAGGYLIGLGASHQFELFVRLVTQAKAEGLGVAHRDVRVLRIERRHVNDRPVVNPRLLHDGTRWILVRHPTVLAGQNQVVGAFEAVVGNAAARLGEWRSARRHFWRASRAAPLALRQWGRLGLASVPALGRKVWNRHGATWASYDTGELGIVRQSDRTGGEGVRASVTPRELFLAWGYEQNPCESSDAGGTPFWGEGMASSDVRNQVPVYRLGARLAHKRGWAPVLDVGCGSGNKLVDHFPASTPTVGVDQVSGITLAREQFPDRQWIAGDLSNDAVWTELAAVRPGLTLCVDVIEHVEDPIELLHRLAGVSAGAPVIISTPDRARYDPDRPLGPPNHARHMREWTHDQFELLLLSAGYEVERSWHRLPRSYSLTRIEINRTVYRALKRQPVPDGRTCMIFLARARS